MSQVTVAADSIDLSLDRGELAKALGASVSPNAKIADLFILSVPAQLRQAGKGKRIVIAGGTRRDVNVGLVRLLQEAFAASTNLLSDSDETLNAMTAQLGKSKGHLTWLMRLTYLSPEIVSAILAGSQPVELTPRRLLRLSQELPHDWAEQRAYLGFDR